MVKLKPNQAAHPIFALFLDTPSLKDMHVKIPGVYIAGTTQDSEKEWKGYGLFESSSETGSYEKRGSFTQRARIGICSTVPLSSSSINRRLVDYASSITVEMLHPNDELESVTENEMLGGRNRFLVGNEIIGAANAVLTSTNEFTGLRTYTLSTLLRGIKDTYPDIDTHVVNETCVWLDGPGLWFVEFPTSRIGETRYYKLVPGGGIIAESQAYKINITGATVKPFRPVQIQGSRNGSNDLTVTWERTPRRSTQFLEQANPIDEDIERYKIRFLQSPTATVALREVTITEDRTYTYTAAQQTTDGLTPGNPVSLELLQTSSLVHEGFSTIETV